MNSSHRMRSRHWYSLSLLCLVMTFTQCRGKLRLLEPPSRSSMWKFGYDTPKNEKDAELSCGGKKVQWKTNGGKCGVCGDPYNGKKEHEPGGKYANGIIVRKYNIEGLMDVNIAFEETQEGAYVEFHLCPSDDPFNNVTQECLDKYLLEIDDKSGRHGITRFTPPKIEKMTIVAVVVKLPRVICRACMLQVIWKAGKDQEQFYACADIAIGATEVKLGVKPSDMEDPKRQNREKTVKYASMSVKPVAGLDCMYSLPIVLSIHFL